MKKNVLEWSVFGIGVVLLLGMVGLLLRDALTSEDRPAQIVVSLGRPERRGDGFVVPVTARNLGGVTAQAVQVSVDLKPPKGESETATVVFDYVPRGSHREGEATFASDPSQGALSSRTAGYQLP